MYTRVCQLTWPFLLTCILLFMHDVYGCKGLNLLCKKSPYFVVVMAKKYMIVCVHVHLYICQSFNLEPIHVRVRVAMHISNVQIMCTYVELLLSMVMHYYFKCTLPRRGRHLP